MFMTKPTPKLRATINTTDSTIREVPEIKSPYIKSLTPLVKGMPGKKGSMAPIMIISVFCPKPVIVSKLAKMAMKMPKSRWSKTEKTF